MTTKERRRIVAQVAVEAIVNDPMAYDVDTTDVVRAEARATGVSSFYIDMLPDNV